MDSYSYIMVIRTLNSDGSDYDPMEQDDYENLIDQLERFGTVLTAVQKEHSTLIEGVFDGLSNVYLLTDNLMFYEYYLRISDFTSDVELEDEDFRSRPDEGYSYYLSLCRSSESPDGDVIHTPIGEHDHEIFKDLLEGMGDLRVAEEREEYSFFRGYFDDLYNLDVLLDICNINPSDPINYDLIIEDFLF